MKAIILAGGEGTRLRPLSLLKPKPMLPLFDRPLLEHLILLLKSCGYTEICMTLQYLPQMIRDYFGDGESFGVSLEYRQETEPRGTAGSVRNCADFIGREEVLIISGDAACSFDLRAMMEKHRISGADATILTQTSDQPLEFGLVLTEEDGRVRSFVEKPGPERVCTDQINTGIYILSPGLLEEIPGDRPCDFGSELFPRLLREKRRLRVYQPRGYWNDVGSVDAYRQTCRDVLSGRFRLPEGGHPLGNTRGSFWVSPEAEVSPEAVIGPGSVIGAGSRIGPGCRVTDCILDGATLSRGCTAEGAVLSGGVYLERDVQLREGCVLSEGVTIGAGSLLREGVRLWPGVSVPAGSVVTESISHSGRFYLPRFTPGGQLRGEAIRELTPELLLRMGRSAAGARVASSAAGGSYARLLADAFLLGAGAGGSEVFRMDASLPSMAAAAGSVYGMDVTLFSRQEGSRVCLYFTGPEGLPLERRRQRALEASVNTEAAPAPAEKCASAVWLTGTEEAVISGIAAGAGELRGLRLACSSKLLQGILKRAGAEVLPPEEGIPQLQLSEDGYSMQILDEEGKSHGWSELLCALTKLELRGGERALALPYAAPAAAERIAEEENGTIYRLERDGEEALALFRKRPWCRDGVTLSLRLLGLFRKGGEFSSLAELFRSLPDFHLFERDVCTDGPDTAVLRELAREADSEIVSGVRLREGECTATIRRLRPGELRILAESAKVEAAEEFCSRLARRIQALDGKPDATSKERA